MCLENGLHRRLGRIQEAGFVEGKAVRLFDSVKESLAFDPCRRQRRTPLGYDGCFGPIGLCQCEAELVLWRHGDKYIQRRPTENGAVVKA